MPLPKPELGLVVHYGFVWAAPDRRPPPDHGKNRPCLIVGLRDINEPSAGGRRVLRVIYLPISHMAPRQGEQAIAIPSRVARHLGLSAETSFLYTSYAVEDDWPFDVAPIPGTEGRFDYGLVPPNFFAMVTREFADFLTKYPRLPHRR